MKKLSEDLHELSGHVANAENKVAAVEEASKEKIHASLKKSKEDSKARQASFTDNLSEKPAAAGFQWEELQDNFNQKIQQIKNKRETEKEAREARRAQHRADDAVWDAVAAIDFAMLAVDEAELAILEALDAQAYADLLA